MALKYGNTGNGGGVRIAKGGIWCWRLSSGADPSSDRATCQTSHWLDIPEAKIIRKNHRGICNTGGYAQSVETSEGFDENEIYITPKEDTERTLTCSNCCENLIQPSQLPANIQWAEMGHGMLVWATDDSGEKALSVTFIPTMDN